MDLSRLPVLILDIQVPTSQENPNPYPILYKINQLFDEFANLSILVISMHAQRTMIHTLMEAGASGYILKEDHASIQKLPSIIKEVADGGIYMSKAAYQELMKSRQGDYDKPLSKRQLDTLSLAAAYPNASTSELALMLGVAHSTLRNFLWGSYIKLGVNTRAAAISEARRLGLLVPDNT